MTDIVSLLGADAEDLLGHRCTTIPRDMLHLPGGDFVERVIASSDRTPGVLRAMQTLFDNGRLGGTGQSYAARRQRVDDPDTGAQHDATRSF